MHPARKLEDRARAAGLAGILVIGACVGVARSEPGARDRTLPRAIALGAAQSVHLRAPFGYVEVLPGDGDSVVADLERRCSHGGRRCEERLARIELETRSQADRLELRVKGTPHWGNRGVDLELRVRIPPGHPLDIHLGAGEARIGRVTSDVRVHLGAGEIDVRMPAAAVRSVDLEAGVGDVDLRLQGERIETRRRHLVGAAVRWKEGRGAARVDLKVGAGKAKLRLE